GMLGASIALSISDIPFNGPIGGVSIGLIEDEIIFNPTFDQRQKTEMNVTLCCSYEKVVMIEAEGNEIPENIMLEAIEKGHEHIKEVIKFILSIQKEIGKEKIAFESKEINKQVFDTMYEYCVEKVKLALDTDDKNIRDKAMGIIIEDLRENFKDLHEENSKIISECIYKIQKKIVRQWLLDGKRVDGRKLNEMRPLDAQVQLIPRVHGSGMFTRGQTQVLSIATLGAMGDAQLLDGIDEDIEKRYMHHYNFPSYSVGETRPSRGPGRREIGHGALAEKALIPVLPSEEEFPYAIRVVSEILSSNGSTSQGSICGTTLALMDAGVPIKAPVAGISCGLITHENKWMTMIDIQGVEDFFGDMDFKVAGTHKGITAIQVDIKIDGLTIDVVKEALLSTKEARIHILDEVMLPVINAPRKELSPYAPKMISLKINPDKIRQVIGSGGKVIQKICADCEVKIDIEEDGRIFISGVSADGLQRAKDVISAITLEPEIGATYKGKVTKILNFGAFVEIAPGKEGLVHISKLDIKRVEKVEDIVAVGDEITVKITEIDNQGRINLSRKDVLIEIENSQNSETSN
ncbi:MAG: polyribonucleotide nucleotidyltransferase, partial [Oscillospiraceae bacterium]